jgi:predicted RNA-binding protein with PIN domain
MAEDPKKKSNTAALVAIGASLVAIGISTSDTLDNQTVFGIPGNWVSGFLLGSAVAILLIAILRARKAT